MQFSNIASCNMMQIDFVGLNELSGGKFLAVNYVSFSKEPCNEIPRKQIEG